MIRTFRALLRPILKCYFRTITVAVLAIGWMACAQLSQSQASAGTVIESPDSQAQVIAPAGFLPGLERPACDDTTFLLVSAAGRYSLLYDTTYRQAAWVAYLLTRADVKAKGAKRSGSFRRDPEVVGRRWPSASDADYVRSGYDRGHLLPSADRTVTAEENKATFYLSNISPQYPGLNRKIWKHLEEQVRRWAQDYDSLYIVTGPVLDDGLPRIGKGGVGVPTAYFKALLVSHNDAYQAVGFMIPNQSHIEGHFRDYALSITELECLSGYDFFYQLSDSLQRAVECTWDPQFWH